MRFEANANVVFAFEAKPLSGAVGKRLVGSPLQNSQPRKGLKMSKANGDPQAIAKDGNSGAGALLLG